MKSLLKIIVMLLPYVLDWVNGYVRERRRRERQAKRDEAKSDPGAAFAGHFDSGVQPPAEESGDAAATSEADDRG